MSGTDRPHPFFARVYPAARRRLDEAGLLRRRRALLAGLRGLVVEVGAGEGANLALYPDAVERVVAIEPEPRLRAAAQEVARGQAGRIEVVPGLAEELPHGDGAADAAVLTLVLCSLPDPAAALAEVRRVLRPGGTLAVLEHVRAPTAGMARVQDVLDRTVWPRLAGGCHLGRDAAAAVRAAGFEVVEEASFDVPRGRTPVSAHVSLLARRP